MENTQTLVIRLPEDNQEMRATVAAIETALPGARVTAWSKGHRLQVCDRMHELVEEYCGKRCDNPYVTSPDDCDEDYCPLLQALKIWDGRQEI